MDNSDTAEYCAFHGCFSTLVNGVKNDVESVARKTCASNLISSDNLTNATNQTQDEHYRTTKLLVKISARIIQNPACFDSFVTILKNISTMEDLSQQLTSEYEHAKQQMQEVSEQSPSHSLSTDSQEGLSDPQQSISIANLEQNFATLVSQCTNSREITPRALANIILCLNLFDSESDMDESLVADCKTDLQQASSNAAIFKIVKPYMSFLNPELLGHIIEFLGTNQDRKNFKRYMKALEQCCKVTKAVLLHHQPDEMSKTDKAFQQVEIVMETPIVNLESIRILQLKMAKILKLNIATLQIKTNVEAHPMACFFQVPNFACAKVFPLSNEQKRELKALGLTSLKCGEYTFENSGAQSDKVSGEVIEMPCLGRPFCLGMVYDCRNDKLLDTPLFKKGVIQPLVEEIPQVSQSCEVLEDDSLETKSLSLGLTPSLKLSLMSNQVQTVSKSAKYWHDCCKSKRQVRVGLKYTSTVVKKQLSTNNLPEQQYQIPRGATHVVTGVLYGSNTYCVFDHTLRENEKFADVHASMLTMVKSVKALTSSQTDSPLLARYCKVYSDTEHSTLREVIKQNDPSIKEKPTPVPIKVWLYPVDKLLKRSTTVKREVSIRLSLVDQLQSKLEYLHNIEIHANDLLKQYDTKFQLFKTRVNRFIRIITTYKNELQKEVARLLPLVLAGSVKAESELAKVVESPLKYEFEVSYWLKLVKEEISTLDMLTKQLQHVEFVPHQKLQSISKKLDSGCLVSFSFHVALEDDETLSYLQSCLQNKEVKQSLSETQQWYTNTDMMKKIMSRIECFRVFAESNGQNKSNRFVFTIYKPIAGAQVAATQSEPISILLYEGTTCKPWEPPGPPGKPTVKEVTHDTVQLEWSQPEYGSQSVECYQVSYHPVDQSQNSCLVKIDATKETATISELTEGTKYVFYIQATCKLGLSEKIRVVETEIIVSPALDGTENEEGIPQSLSNKPIAIAVTHNSVTLEWAQPEQYADNIEGYTILYQEVNSSKKSKWQKYESTNGLDRTDTVTGLSPQTKYVFKVRPELEDGESGTSSEASDPIETKKAASTIVGTIPPSSIKLQAKQESRSKVIVPELETLSKQRLIFYGKPVASNVAHDRVKLKLTKLESGTEDTKSCIIYYCQANNTETNDWEMKIFDDIQDCVTIKGLNRNTEYVFKVTSKDKTNIGPESEVSDPIQTKATSPPGKPVASAVTHNSITVKWSKPEHGHNNIKSYSVIYFPKNQPEKKSLIEVAHEEATITSLTLLESYVIIVQPICEIGVGTESEPSDPIETKATSSPGKPVATKVTHDSISLKWDPPKDYHQDIDYYIIFYRFSTEKWKNKTSHSPTITIPALIPNTAYEFVLRAITKNGNKGCDSPSSMQIKTKPSSPPGKPTAEGMSHDRIILSWSKPDHGAENGTNYVILQHNKNEPDTEEWKVERTKSMSTRAAIKGLDPSTEYLFKVKLVCSTGESDESKVSDPIKTKPVCKPGKPYATKVTHNSIILTWEIPEEFSTNVETYTILPVTKTDDSDSDWEKSVKAQCHPHKIESTTILNLNRGVMYKFKVVPSGNDDNVVYVESEPSDLIVTKATSQPGQPIVEGITNDMATVKWTHPDQGKKKILHYTVCYCPADDPTSDWKEQNTSGLQTFQVITGLSRKTKYAFKVIPKCKDRIEGTESKASIPFETTSTSPPGVPEATEVAYNSISLKWAPPETGGENVSSYTVYYSEAHIKQPVWKHQATNNNSTEIVIGELETNKYYQFKLKVQCKPGCGVGAESKTSEPIQTSMCCKTGMPRASVVTHNKIGLEWDKPLYEYDKIIYYEVAYKVKTSLNWEKAITQDCQEKIVLTGLSPNHEYIVKVRPVCKDTDMNLPFAFSSHIKTKDKPLAERVLSKCSPDDSIVPGGPDCIQVNRIPSQKQVMKDETKQIAKYHIGKPSDPGTPEKVILLVGATGAGKSTLINSIANYILGVSWETPFRFKLIEDEQVSQAHSQTSWLTAYTFHAQKDSPLNYDLTIVDTPGFGDTRGVERDKEITKQIKEFFSVKPPKGIDSIHAIGFVAQAALPRLTATQKYIFDSVLAIFGKDIAGNIFLMATFADSQTPKVLSAIKEADIKCKRCIKFNNSVLYTCTNAGGEFDKLFWEMNEKSMKAFFETDLRATNSISLQLTKEVLQQREHFETLVHGLKEKIQMGLNLIQEIQQEEKILKDRDILDPNFTYEVDVAKTREVELPKGKFATNCTECNFTCHNPCNITDNLKTYNCAAMGGLWILRGQNSKCAVCPNKCHWKKHEQQTYLIVVYKEKETRTLQDLMERYLEAVESDDESTESDKTDQMLSIARGNLRTLNKEVLDLIKQTQACVKRLQEIAYKPHPLNEADYIDLMIESEKREGKDGFAGRISALEELKEQAKLVSTLAHPTNDTFTDVGAEPKPTKNWWKLGSRALSFVRNRKGRQQ